MWVNEGACVVSLQCNMTLLVSPCHSSPRRALTPSSASCWGTRSSVTRLSSAMAWCPLELTGICMATSLPLPDS